MPPRDDSFPLRLQVALDRGAGGEAEQPSDQEERKRLRQKIAALSAILVVLAVLALLIVRALSGHSPLPSLSSTLPHYVSSIYGVSQPMGVAVSPSGERIYVTESEGPRLVRVFDRSGKRVGSLAPPPVNGNHNWHLPVYVAVDPRTEQVYVSDRLREDIDVYASNGKYLRSMRPSGALGNGSQPLGLTFGAEGDLYMTDVGGSRRNHRVLVIGAGGSKSLRKVGSAGMFWFPNGLAVDSHRDVYVADSNDGRLAILDPSGRLVSSIARGVGEGDLNLPRGVAIDSHNRLYVVDATAQVVDVYQLSSRVAEVPRYIGSFGGEGLGNGQFQYPNGIAIEGGRIYITDRENGRVQVWEY
ncbi:MAG TPA: hypothetical protein VIC05_13055 [Solirubrobacteraceae bacterium]|jgi:DNA-binding beta-propeller fold protein YncE